MTNTKRRSMAWQFAGALALAGIVTMNAGIARALEIIPSAGITKSTDENAGDAKAFGGLAARGSLLPFLKLEAGIGYRQDSFAGGDVKVRQWPVTTSLWLTPLPIFYAGGGIGWYRTTLDYADGLLIEDSTSMQTGFHVGGGANFPIAPRLGLDLNARYIFMGEDNNNVQVPTTFDPDFWTTSVGLAISF